MTYRSDFPVFETHPSLVYLDSAATAQKPQAVIDAVTAAMASAANAHRGLYPLALAATEKYEQARATVARFIGGQEREIVFTRNATESVNLVAATLDWKKGDEVILSASEHHANLLPWHRAGITLRFLEVTAAGEIDLAQLPGLLNERTRLVALSHCSNVLGRINPIAQVAKIIRQGSEALLLVDASQTAPHIPLSVQELDADFLVFSGHKLYGPSGIGILWGRAELLETLPPYQVGGEMIRTVSRNSATWNDIPWRFEAGTPNLEGAVGLAAAISYLEGIGMEQVAAHTAGLATYARSRLAEIDGLTLLGDPSPESGILSFTVDDIHPHDLAEELGKRDICIRAGHHCAAPLHETLGIAASARISLGLHNEKKDIDRFVAAANEIIAEYRNA